MLCTRDDARHYMAKLPERHAMTSQWQAAAKCLLDGADTETVTSAIELALLFDGRLDAKLANDGWKTK